MEGGRSVGLVLEEEVDLQRYEIWRSYLMMTKLKEHLPAPSFC